jgi:hypothetical protein
MELSTDITKKSSINIYEDFLSNKFISNLKISLNEIYLKFKNDENIIEYFSQNSSFQLDKESIINTGYLNYIIYPIYYFFDKNLNPDLGSFISVRKKLRELYNFDEIFDLNSSSIIDVPSNIHSTILYKFELNNKKYIYYSNSGLGIKNNLRFNTNDNNFVAPKIFEVKNDKLYNFIPIYINFILFYIIELNKGSIKRGGINKFMEKYTTYLEKYKKKYNCNFIDKITIDPNDFESIIKDINGDKIFSTPDRAEKCINLCYALLYFISSKLKDEFKEIFFINLISKKEYEKNKLLERYLSSESINNIKLNDLYINSNRYNFEISKEISNFIKDSIIKEDDELNNFNIFIDEINKKFDKLSLISESIKFKLDQLKIHFNNFVILNPEQKSGSCAFYSYYYLKNITLIKIYNNTELNFNEKVNLYINKILNFHYKMIHLYGLSQDTDILKNVAYKGVDYFNYNYINSLCDINKLTDEFINVYDKDTFILNNKKKQRCDHLLNFNINGTYKIHDNIKIESTNYNFYIELVDFLGDKINIIRKTSIDKLIGNNNPNKLKTQFDEKFDKLYIEIKKDYYLNLIFDANKWDSLKNMYYIYLLLLIYIHNSDNEEFVKNENISNYKKTSNKYLYYFLYIHHIKPDIKTGETIDTLLSAKKIINIEYDILFLLLETNEKKNIFLVLEKVKNFKGLEDLINTIFKFNSFDIYMLNEHELIRFCTIDNEYYYNFYYLFNNDINLYDDYDFDFESEISSDYIYKNIYLFFCKNNFLQNNDYINQELKNNYKNKINYIIKYFRKSLIKKKKYLNNNTENIYCMNITELLIILTNYKETYINIKTNIKTLFGYNYLPLFKILACCKLSIKSSDRTNLIIQNDEICSSEDLIEYININSLNENDDSWIEGNIIYKIFKKSDEINFKWIKNIGFETDNYKLFSYKNKDFYRLFPKNNNIYNILIRFGLSEEEKDHFLILCEKKYYNESENTLTYSNLGELIIITSINHHILQSKCIILNINNNFIDKNNVYIIDNYNNKLLLLFDLTIEKYPFLSFIPKDVIYFFYRDIINNSFEYLPRLGDFYENKNKLQLIINSNFKKIQCYFIENMFEINYDYKINRNMSINEYCEKDYEYSNKNYYSSENLKSVILNFEFGPSLIFPVNDFDINNYKYCFSFYRSKIINLSDYKWDTFYKINNSENLEIFNNEIEKKLIPFCKCKIKYEIGNEKKILTNYKINENTVNKFINTHHFCSLLYCSNDNLKKLINTSILKDNIEKILSTIENENYYLDNINNYIINNFEKWLLIMENNILIEIVNSLSNIKISCWDIQFNLTKLNSLLLFNKKILEEGNYYNFEILFLLQSNYFYNEQQMEKYYEIRKDLIKKNPNLKVHQFMMGRGKTSVFTPLLSLCIKYLSKKDPTVITANHLVESSKKILKLSELILDTNINIFSDYNAKERWIKNYYPKKYIDNLEIENEYNIIDEFDSHHNYLESMFNYVLLKSNILEEYIFNYIFDYTFYKIKNKNIEFNPNIIENYNKVILEYPLLNKNLELFYNISKTMKYRMNYGFSFLYENNKNNSFRVCTPFSRKDTPVKKSDFSSILLTLILTFKTYILEFESCLKDFDFENILENIIILDKFYKIKENLNESILPNKNLHVLDELNNFIINYNLESEKSKEEMTHIFNNIYKINNNSFIDNIKNQILKIYLYEINKEKIKYAEKQLNISFIDIIYNNYEQWQVGYTGTAYLKLNE